MVVKSPLEYGVVPTDWPIQDGADRTPYVGPTQAGILTKIIYPTKGYTEFAYEQNNYSNLDASTTTDLPIGGLRIQKITSKGSDVADRVLSYEYLDGTRSSGKRMSPTKNYYYWPKA
ncbi:MAG: hypothetical protein JWR44_402, partial [Hymenobacter sp.]|nr:hypothetical protein [Hymenobacter sp.]